MDERLHFEDFIEGQIFQLGEKSVTRAELTCFARDYDPQPFHLDEEAARHSILGGLAVSGWHTAAIAMRLLADGLLNRSASQGAPGVDKLRWLKPVLAGDVVQVETAVVSKRPLATRPSLGLVYFKMTVLNQREELVMTQENPILFLRRASRA
ncbi:acyl dehydratase [Roseibium hamelinense]|uniref:Acyl dehydratase n=1 Tax=Roseibium hamelinense TaxID=150831 RepID=A0A562SXQ5_9HYPH|nr:MaoC family dehydratase [Roseibium hamelinense]MTI43611.1 MaoC family dehydratase [Roseibium hamelinense]TWI86127.1 acyl dehydratase [Roseibium hamelinense]